MTYPAFVSDANVNFDGTTTKVALLLAGDPAWLVVYDNLDTKGQSDLALLVAANGGSLPLSNETVARSFMLNNGRSWYDTYLGATKYVPAKLNSPGAGGSSVNTYWDGTDWRYETTDDVVSSGGGGGAAAGDVAHDAVDSGNPMKIGGKAHTGYPTPVADADRVNGWFDHYGKVTMSLGSGLTSNGDSYNSAQVGIFSPGDINGYPLAVMNRVYNPSAPGWDRMRGDTNGTWAQGNVAHDAVDAGSPIKIGGKASSTVPTDVATGDRVNTWHDLKGRIHVALAADNGVTALPQPMNAQVGVGVMALPTMSANLFLDSTNLNWRQAHLIMSNYRLLSSGATTNAVNVLNTFGFLFGITLSNTAASDRYLKLYNKATAPTVGTDTPVYTFLIPASTKNLRVALPEHPAGIPFFSGISFAITANAADADTTAIVAGDIVCMNIQYSAN